MSMSKRDYEKWLDSLPEDERDADDFPHPDDPTDDELRALANELPADPQPTGAGCDDPIPY